MSDLYDSLEDERDEHKLSSDFLGRRKTHSSDSVGGDGKGDSTEKYSFFLNQNVNKKDQTLQSIFKFSNVLPEKKNFLPQIKSIDRAEGPESASGVAVDKRSLDQQGLQLNDDGSFTKSPRENAEELPFITREYRNLQFQKRKTYKMNKKSPCAKQEEKNMFGLTYPGNQQTQQTNARQKKGSTEELRSPSCRKSQTKPDKQLTPNYNLTDSMKEKILRTVKTEWEQKELKNPKPRSKREINSHETVETCRRETETAGKRKMNRTKSENLSPIERFQKTSSDLVGDARKPKNVPQKISKYKSDILLNGSKHKLNYSERQQMKSGFNPFYLRHEGRKIRSDTNRSNFGDSEMDELPEVSSRVGTRANFSDEEEEVFYMKLIEEDRHQKQTQHSSRSEGPMEQLSLKRISGPNSHKAVRETMSGRNNSRCKHNSKSMFIDIPSEGGHSVTPLKKYSHFCSGHSSPNMSKVELALKAKTYGYLANARNIFKLKAQSEGKFSATEREKNQKNTSPKKASDSPTGVKLAKQYSLPVNGFPSVQTELLRASPSFPRGIGSTGQQQKQPETCEGSPKEFALPQVNISAELKGGKMNARLFERINYCLKGPNV